MSPSIVTFLVTRTNSAVFNEVLTAALNQTIPHHLVVIDAAQGAGINNHLNRQRKGVHIHYVRTPGVGSFAHAISEAMADPQIQDLQANADCYWFLHEDSIPDANALAEQCRVMQTGESIAVVGAKQHGPGGEIYEVGITATRTGRRIETATEDEQDQGQYDGRSDVLAVGTPAMLVKAHIWHEAGGFTRLVSPYHDGQELCRRIRRMGYRVLVAPAARVVHHRVSMNDDTQGQWKKRRANINMATLALPFWYLPIMPFYVCIVQLLRAVGRALYVHPRLAAVELMALLSWLIEIPALVGRKISARLNSTVPLSAVHAIESPWYAHWQRLMWERKRIERIGGQEALPHVFAAVRHYRRRYWGACGGLLLLSALSSLIVWADFITQNFHEQAIVTGSSWADLPSTWTQLWNIARNGTTTQTTPHTLDPLVSFAALILAPLAPFITPAHALHWAWAGAMLASAVGMWWASGILTPRVGTRLLAASVWLSQPAFLISLYVGHIGSVLFHVSLPYAVAAIAKLLAVHYAFDLRTHMGSVTYQRILHKRWIGVSALSITAMVSALPSSSVLVVATLICVTIIAVRRPGLSLDTVHFTPLRSRIVSAWLSTLPAAILTTPYLYDVITTRSWPVLLSAAGSIPVTEGIVSGNPSPQALMLGLPAGQITVGRTQNVEWLLIAVMSFSWIIVIALGALTCARVVRVFSLKKIRLHALNILPVVVGLAATATAFVLSYLPAQMHVPQWHQLVSRHNTEELSRAVSSDTLGYVRVDEFLAAHHSVYTWVAPAFSLAAAAFLMFYVLHARTRKDHRMQMGLLALLWCATVATSVVAVSVNSPQLTLNHLNIGSAYSLPVSVLNDQSHHQDVALIVPAGQQVYVYRMSANGVLLSDSSTLSRYKEMKQAQNRAQKGTSHTLLTRDDSVSQALATLTIAPDEMSAQRLVENGIGSIALLRLPTAENERVAHILAQTPGISPGAHTAALQLWRLDTISTQTHSAHNTQPHTSHVGKQLLGLNTIQWNNIRLIFVGITLTLALLWSLPTPKRRRIHLHPHQGHNP